MQLMFPEEIDVWYVFPALRREIAVELKKIGMKSNKIAELLGITKAAVSQYLSGKRASKISFTDNMKSKIKNAAVKIKEGASVVTTPNTQADAERWNVDFDSVSGELERKYRNNVRGLAAAAGIDPATLETQDGINSFIK